MVPKYKKLILMFQKEVADKILAKYNTLIMEDLAITNARLKLLIILMFHQIVFILFQKLNLQSCI